jgi:hypothetical protein
MGAVVSARGIQCGLCLTAAVALLSLATQAPLNEAGFLACIGAACVLLANAYAFLSAYEL